MTDLAGLALGRVHCADALRAPFPWFGGKRRAAHLVWPRFGDCSNYVEPFFGSGAMLLARPHWSWPDGFPGRNHTETVNDLDGCVTNYHSRDVAAQVRAWCLERGGSPDMRIALCGYDTEHGELERAGWSVVAWKASGGYANAGRNRAEDGAENRDRERIWFSPHCLAEHRAGQGALFGGEQ